MAEFMTDLLWVFLYTLRDVLPIVLLLIFFQVIVLKQSIPHLPLIYKEFIMWSGLEFDGQQVIDQAISLLTPFMPLVYIFGGITVFALIMFVIFGIARKSSS